MGTHAVAIAETGSLTLVPADTTFTWRTRGPIAFAHLYLTPSQLEDTISLQYEQHGRGASLIERVGYDDALLQPLFSAMLGEIAYAESTSALLLDSLLESFLIRLAHADATRVMLMTGDKSLATVASLCGFNSHRQFSVIFKAMTGVGPKQFRILNQPRLRNVQQSANG